MIKFALKISLIFCMILLLGSVDDELFKVPYARAIYSEDGQLLGAKVAADGQWRFPVVQDVPLKYETALVAFEDKRFHFHPGLDPFAILRAIGQNIKAGKIVSGGSTLTMQVIRMSRKNRRTLKAKLLEGLQAIAIELKYTKKEILLLYANHAPFGGNVVGIQAATWRYFGKGPADISWAEAALLAVLPNAPSLLHPGKNRAPLKAKRDRLLNKLYQHGYFDKTLYELSILEPIPTSPQPLPQIASHLTSSLSGKLNIDYELQNKIDDIADFNHEILSQRNIHNLAIIVVENKTGKVLAYAGNSKGQKHENHVDMVKAYRSSGSILKPLLYALSLQEGLITPQQLLKDIPYDYHGFRPKNYNKLFYGAVPADEALSRSLNVPAVNLLQAYGIDRFLNALSQIGITSLNRGAENYGLSLILGGGEVNLWEVVQSYCMMSQQLNQYYQDTVTIYPLSLQGINASRHLNLTPGSIYATYEAMKNLERPGTEGSWESFSSSVQLAWKTGTSYGHRDAWAVGTCPQFTIGVWVGNADGEGNAEIVGSTAAGSILFDVVNSLPIDPAWFPFPHDDMRKKAICPHSGYIAGPYCQQSYIKAIPKTSIWAPPCPYHHLVHLDKDPRLRSFNHCSNLLLDTTWFTLPTLMENYYQKSHLEYQPLPPISPLCTKKITADALAIIYPTEGSEIYLPKGLTGIKQPFISKAVNSIESPLYWHLNGKYKGMTEGVHEFSLPLNPGDYKLTVINGLGDQLSRHFTIVGEEKHDLFAGLN